MSARARTVLCALLVSCGGAHEGARAEIAKPSATATSSAPALLHVDPTLREMSAVRELPVLRDVARVVLGRAALLGKVRAHVDREVPHVEIECESAFLKALGVIASDVDYERAVYDVLGESTGGMYEPFDGTMYVPEDLEEHELITTIAHESVHALQDQHFDLKLFDRFVPGASDTMLAHSCLAEGDAMSATEEEPSLNATTYIEREIAAPYVTGTTFVKALRTRGGWTEVDRAWTRGGLTTEQILHPDKWARAEPALAVPAPTFATLGAQFGNASVDVHGELGLRLVLESAVPEGRAALAASDWGGDTSLLVHDGARTALAWRIRWDDDASAARGYETIRGAFTNGAACASVRAAPVSVTHEARDVLLLVGPPGSDCGLLARWSKEIFAR